MAYIDFFNIKIFFFSFMASITGYTIANTSGFLGFV